MKPFLVVACLLGCLSPCGILGQQTFVITDNQGAGTGTTTFSRKHAYLLDGPVFVNPGDVLSIESGTVLRGRYSDVSGEIAALIVSRGAQLRAEGTENEPIIFTSEGDDLETVGNTTCPNPEVTFLSDLPFEEEYNGWGPVERDQSNGEFFANDGSPIQMNGKVYAKGLGMHASDPDPPNPILLLDNDTAHVTFDLDGKYTTFKSDIGAADEFAFVNGEPSVLSIEFVVRVDGVEKFRSGLIQPGDYIQYVEVDVSGAEELELQLLNGGSVNETANGNRKDFDHGVWGNARLENCEERGDAIQSSNIDPSAFDVAQWGGLILLGNSPANIPVQNRFIAGLPDDPRNSYGGPRIVDNSGILRYVSIRHGGGLLNYEEGFHANGLTLAGVGSGTVVEHIEVFASGDDGMEICGGTVNVKWLAMAFASDDGFDIDQGFQGRGQFWLSFANRGADLGASHDGGNRNLERPFTLPKVYNATLFGGANGSPGNRYSMLFADGAGGRYANSIFVGFAQGVFIESVNNEADSYNQFLNGNLELRSNLFWDIASIGPDCNELVVPTEGASEGVSEVLKEYFESANNIYNNPVFRTYNAQSYTPGQEAFLPLPEVGGYAYRGLEDLPDADTSSFYDKVGYKGAFGEDMWLSGWSALSAYGYLGTKGGNDNPNTLKADLVLENVSPLPNPLVAGQSFTLSLDVQNRGSFKSLPTAVRATLEGFGTPLDIEEISSLGKGKGLTNLTLSLTLPANLSGAQELVIEVDPEGLVEEANRNNNLTVLPFALEEIDELPDVAISSFSVSENPTTPGATISLNFDVENKGELATGIIPLSILLGEAEIVLLQANIANLEPGEIRSVMRTISIPNEVLLGEVLLQVLLDPQNVILEENENNNQASLDLEILDLLPDLEVQEVQAEVNSVKVGELFSLSITIENTGEANSGPFDLWITANGELVSSRQLPGLPVGSSSFLELQVALPASITSDEVELTVLIDPDDKILEESKDNNSRSIKLEVIPSERQFADLALGILTPETDSLTLEAGQGFNILIRIENGNGDTVALANQIRLELNDQLIDTLEQPALDRVEFRDINREILIPDLIPPGFYKFVAKVDAKDEVVEKSEGNNSDTLVIVVKSPNSGGDPLSITQTNFPRFHTMREGTTSSPSITVSDFSKVDRVEFSFKPISGFLGAFQTIEASNNGTTTFSASFTDSEVGEIGLSYYFTVYNKATDESDIQSEWGHTYLRYNGEGLTLPSIKTGNTVPNYQILSIPLNLDNASISNTFIDDINSDENQTRWRLMQWNGNSTLDLAANSLVSVGRSYWLLIVDPATIDTGPGTTVEVTESSPLTLNLSSQFTQVGNPYNFALSWSDILQANGNPEGLTFSTYNDGYTPDDRLEAFEGGFIQNNGPATSLEIPVFKNENINRLAANKPLNPLSAPHWKLPIYLQSGELNYRVGGLAMHPDASENWDIKDVAGFPLFDSYLDLGFPKEGHSFDRLTFDYVPTRAQYSWEMLVSSNQGKVINISWENQHFGENSQQLWLEDLETGIVIDMRTQESFSFYPSAQDSRFRIHFGDLEYVKSQVKELKAWISTPLPNPFSDRLSFSLHFPPLIGPSRVSCSLHNLMGQKVGFKEWSIKDVGGIQTKWNLQASSLPKGVYIYTIQILTKQGKEVKSGKLIKR